MFVEPVTPIDVTTMTLPSASYGDPGCTRPSAEGSFVQLLEKPGARRAHRESRWVPDRLELRTAQRCYESAFDRRAGDVLFAGVVGHVARVVAVAIGGPRLGLLVAH